MIINESLLEQELLTTVEKPGQYRGGELHTVVKDWDAAPAKMAFAFPDLYEIGMSHLGLRLLYEAINNHSPHLCERVFMPGSDMAALLKEKGLPLFALESRHGLADFDVVGFTLQYELSYTNILAMLDLAGIPLTSDARKDSDPIIAAGGPCAYNPEPLADIVDLFFIGEGEELDIQLLDLIAEVRAAGGSREDILRRAAAIPGIYVPSFYEVTYDAEGNFASIAKAANAPEETALPVKKRIITDLEHAVFPDKPIMPTVEPVHDRIMLEVMRGCGRGCRFCQAGMIYRPIREKSVDTLTCQARAQAAASGYGDMALLSLSTADYSCVSELMDSLLEEYSPQRVSVSLPSLRVDAFSVGLAARTQQVRKSGITLAPEAGSQRLRDIINKGVTEEAILQACGAAFSQGYTHIKLYFMIGLPFETDSDIIAMAELCRQIIRVWKYRRPAEVKRPLQITLGVSSFVPKCDTPFQWQPQCTVEELKRRQDLLKEHIKPMRSVTVNYHDRQGSLLEAVFARGDRKLGKVLLSAYEKGCTMDGWKEYFRPALWMEAFAENGLTPEEYANREMIIDTPLPWGHIDCGVSTKWMWMEYIKAGRAELTEDCRQGKCNGCGVCKGDWQNVFREPRETQMPTPVDLTQPEERYRYRCRLRIDGTAAWLSHLDLLGSVEKTLRRSNLPMAWSTGFNPHMQISWGPAHPVGLYGENEYVDLLLVKRPEGDLCDAFNQVAAPGLTMLEAREIEHHVPALMAAVNYGEYRIELAELADPEALDQRITEVMAAEALPVTRVSSKGNKIVDIRPSIHWIRREEKNIIYGTWMDRGAAVKPAEMLSLLVPEHSGWRCIRTELLIGDKRP